MNRSSWLVVGFVGLICCCVLCCVLLLLNLVANAARPLTPAAFGVDVVLAVVSGTPLRTPLTPLKLVLPLFKVLVVILLVLLFVVVVVEGAGLAGNELVGLF